MTVLEEKDIIYKVAGGDRDAFEALVLANQKNVYNLALKMTRNPDDALDISQEAFIKAYRSLADFRFDARFSVWLYKLTYNLCIDFLRKAATARTVSLDYEDDSGAAAAFDIPDVRELPEDIALRGELRATIDESIAELPERHRDILVMREVTGMSYEDISAALGISCGTVKSRLSRARLRLAEILISKGTFPKNYRHKDVDCDSS